MKAALEEILEMALERGIEAWKGDGGAEGRYCRAEACPSHKVRQDLDVPGARHKRDAGSREEARG